MNKQVFLAFFLSLLVIVGYNYYLAQQSPQTLPDSAFLQTQELEIAEIPEAPAEPLSVASFSEAKEVIIETDLVSIVITSSGARVKSCKLKRYPEEKIDLKKIQTRLTQTEQALSSAPNQEFLQHEKAKLELLLEKGVGDGEAAELVSLAASVSNDFSPAIIIPENQSASIALNQASYKYSQDALFLSPDRPDGRIVFSYTTKEGQTITKIYSFSNYSYAIGLDIVFGGWEDQDFPKNSFLIYSGPNIGLPQAERGRRGAGYSGPVTYFENDQQGWTRKEKYTRKETNVQIKREHREGKVIWTGLENKYFLSAIIPSLPAEAVTIEKDKFNQHKAAALIPWQGSGQYNFRLYLGPRRGEDLKSLGVSLDKTISYGIFSPISKLIYRLLMFFSGWTHNFGWAIILLCLVVKIVFYPLTHHSFEAMQKMQHQMKVVQPAMTALREKHKGNPQKMNKEVMELYKRHKINPMASCQSGCLPLLLQMPVFFALYSVLYNSIELRGAPFFGWITDLSAKDPLYILPVLMGISMFMQQKLTGMGGASGAQADQAKMMAWMMPIMLTWIFSSLPSGVVLYWFIFNLVTSGQQMLIRRKQEAAA